MTESPRWSEPLPPTAGTGGITRFDGISYALVPGFRPLLLDVWVPDTPTPPPVVLWVHGGGWREGDRRYLPPTMPHESLFEKIVRAGLALATVDYRLSGEACFPAQLHDIKAAIRYLRRFADRLGVDASRIGIGGESAGGHLAALAALTPDHAPDLEGTVGVPALSSGVDCAVCWYALTDARPLDLRDPDEHVVAALLGGTDRARAERASPICYVTPSAPPFLLLHGERDSVVPIGQSTAMHAALQAAGVPSEFHPVPGAEHCFDGYPDIPALLDRSVDFWRRRLTAP